MSQTRTNSRSASPINQSSISQDERLQRRADMTKPLQFRSRFNEDIHRRANSTQATMRPLGSANRRLIALRDDHEQIEVAALVRLPPRVRSEQPDLLGLELRGEMPRHFTEDAIADGFRC